jgi:hypothetical protein
MQPFQPPSRMALWCSRVSVAASVVHRTLDVEGLEQGARREFGAGQLFSELIIQAVGIRQGWAFPKCQIPG